MRVSVRYCLIALVYSMSYFWAAGVWADGEDVLEGGATARTANRIQANGRRARERADIVGPPGEMDSRTGSGVQAESRATYWRTPDSSDVGFWAKPAARRRPIGASVK